MSAALRRLVRLGRQAGWPAFVAAAVLEALVFAVVDPADLHGLGGGALGWSRATTYSLGFLVFWATTGAACAVTAWLVAAPRRGD